MVFQFFLSRIFDSWLFSSSMVWPPHVFPPGLSTPRIVHRFCGRREVVANCLPMETLDGIANGGLGKAKCLFEFLKKCLKRESNPSSTVCWASMLNVRPWMVRWVGLIWACGAAATCVWSAYGLRTAILIVSAGKGSNSHAWMAQGVERLLFDPVGAHSILSRGGCSVPRWLHCLSTGGQFVGWTIWGVVHPTRSKRGVDNQEVEKTTIHHNFSVEHLKNKKISGEPSRYS